MMFVLLWLISILTVVTSATATVPLHARFASLRRPRRSRRSTAAANTASGLDCLLLPVVSTSCPTTTTTTTTAVHRRTLTHRPNDDDPDDRVVRPCSSSSSSVVTRSIGNTLLRGALLRIASDISGGTPLETIKTRVTVTTDSPYRAVRNIIQQENGIWSLWTGTSSRTVEGALVGAVFMLGSVVTKTQLKLWGASPTVAALAGGLVGGVAQSVVMTPAGLIFTALNADPQKRQGPKKKDSTSSSSRRGNQENAMQVVRRVVSEKGIAGMYVGIRPMCLRQATNWASRSGFTELSRTIFQLHKYGLLGELGAGAIGGVCSCWNTPIETIRVYMQRDVSQGLSSPQPMYVYWNTIVDQYGYVGLFRGVTPRAVQAIWQTVFLVVVPNLMGL
jgi:Mitochondrial carrier protein